MTNISNELLKRAAEACELCTSKAELQAIIVAPKSEDSLENSVVLCRTCLAQVEQKEDITPNHWRCLNESMWSETPAVQVLAYRMLNRLSAHDWAQDLLGMIYLDEATLEWAQAQDNQVDEKIVHKDSNGHVLEAGDSVVLIKDLKVKGANFIAKRGTAVRRISLVHDNAGHIEGRVDGQHIVILTEFVKKTN